MQLDRVAWSIFFIWVGFTMLVELPWGARFSLAAFASATHSAWRPLDALGKLADRGYRMFGSCLDCARRYDPKLGPRNQPSQYDIDLAALGDERGRDCLVVSMEPVPYPRCGSRRTEIRILPPP